MGRGSVPSLETVCARIGRSGRGWRTLKGGGGCGFPGAAGDTTESGVCRDVAYRVAHRDSANLGPVLTIAEELLDDEAHYDFVMAFLEDLQNLISHPSRRCAGRRISPRGSAHGAVD
jgi:hypothetical protein